MLDVAFWRLRGIMFISSSVLSLGMGVTSTSKIINCFREILMMQASLAQVCCSRSWKDDSLESGRQWSCYFITRYLSAGWLGTPTGCEGNVIAREYALEAGGYGL
jgi:hypothetical protein